MVCIMHECVPYGHLAINGQPMSTAQLARLVGEQEKHVIRWLSELQAADVYSVTEDGIIYSRRMVKDEALRNTRAEAGRLGGNPVLLNQKVNHKVNGHDNESSNQKPTPSSSSSVSTSENKKQKSANADGLFERFYSAYPRKTKRAGALKAWQKLKPDEPLLQTMLQAVDRQKRCEQWQRGIIPHPATWLNDRRWEDELAVDVRPARDMTCQRILPGSNQKCGMPATTEHPVYGLTCEHCNRKEQEALTKTEIPAAVREQLKSLKR